MKQTFSNFRLIFLLLLFCVNSVLAQNQIIIDSLLLITKTNITKTEEVDTYVRISKEYRNNDSTSAANYAYKAIELAKLINYQEGKIDGLLEVAIINAILGNYPKAIKYFEQVIKDSEVVNYQKGELLGLNGLGNINKFYGNYDDALKYLLQSLSIAENLGDKRAIQISTNNIGLIYEKLGYYEQALKYYFQCLEILEDLDLKRRVSFVFNNIGIVYRDQNNPTKALEYFNKALKTLQDFKDKRGIASTLNNIGITYKDMGDYEKALTYFHNALDIFHEFESKRDIVECYINIGSTKNEQEENDEALEYAFKAKKINQQIKAKDNMPYILILIGKIYRKQGQKLRSEKYLMDALRLSKEVGTIGNIRDAAKELSLIKKDLEKYREAYDIQILYQQVLDSIKNDELTRNITQLAENYNFQQEKDSIQFANYTQKLFLEKDIEYRENLQLITSIALTLSLILAIIIFRFYQIKKTSNKLLTKKSNALSVAVKEITIQNKKLEELNDVKNKVFSIISHDLRSPISSLQGLLEVMYSKNELSVEEFDSIISQLADKLTGTSGLLENLLQWARIQMEGAFSFSPENIDLKVLINETVNFLREKYNSKGLKITVDIVREIPTVYIDPEVVRFILRNLLNNAYKFSHINGKVMIKVDIEENYVKSLIIDEGVGMSDVTAANLFDNFVDSQWGTQSEKGTGLGLMLCKELIKKSGGDIGVESKLKQGSTFWFTLPISLP